MSYDDDRGDDGDGGRGEHRGFSLKGYLRYRADVIRSPEYKHDSVLAVIALAFYLCVFVLVGLFGGVYKDTLLYTISFGLAFVCLLYTVIFGTPAKRMAKRLQKEGQQRQVREEADSQARAQH